MQVEMSCLESEGGSGRPLDPREYWNGRAAWFGRSCGSNPYADTFIGRLDLAERCSVLDMGCATGTLAVPLAQAGHAVTACDFAPKMIERLSERAREAGTSIDAKIMAWEDDWDEFGLGVDSVDVAIASRSVMGGQLDECLAKLDCAARSKAAVTVSANALPMLDPCLMEYLGRQVPVLHAAADAIRILSDKGRYPTLSYIPCERPMRFASKERAVMELRRMAGSEPFDNRERILFEDYVQRHFKEEVRDGAPSYCLDRVLTVPWALIIWSPEGLL